MVVDKNMCVRGSCASLIVLQRDQAVRGVASSPADRLSKHTVEQQGGVVSIDLPAQITAGQLSNLLYQALGDSEPFARISGRSTPATCVAVICVRTNEFAGSQDAMPR